MASHIIIIIPCFNEGVRIAECLRGVLAFDIPKDASFDVYVMDGGSNDCTFQAAMQIAVDYPNVYVKENPRRYQGCAVNEVVRATEADFYLWLGAHTIFPQDYLRSCLETAQKTGADVVGGFCRTEIGGEGYGAQLVQAITTHKFGVGDSNFRTSATEGPVDTVAYALFRRSVFERVGLLDERLVRAQDYEFNRRVKMAGMKIWMNPAIQCCYHNQASLFSFYGKQFFLEAPYNAYMWHLAPYAFTPRHAITGVFALGVIGGIVLSPLTSWIAWPFVSVIMLYFLIAVASSLQQALRYRQPLHAVYMPGCFFLFHFIHGLGVLTGLARLMLRIAPVQKKVEPWPDAGRSRAWPIV
jgi:GT2 family glycosyltransferase